MLTRTEAKDYIRQQEPFFLQKAKKTGYICPYCGNGSGSSGDGIVKDKKDPSGTHYKCFVCGKYADVIDLVGEHFGIPDQDYQSKFQKAFEVFGIDVMPDGSPDEYKKVQKHTNMTMTDTEEESLIDFFLKAAASNDFEYLKGRGISEAVQKRFMVGFVPDWISPQAIKTTIERGGDPGNLPRSPRCIIPTSDSSYIARDTREGLSDDQKRYSKMKQGKQNFFNLKALERSSIIFITEGEIDAMSISEVGGEAVGLGSVSMIRGFVSIVEKRYSDHVFILCLDNDEAGQAAQQQLAEALNAHDIQYIEGTQYTHKTSKDPNEALITDKDGFRKAVSFLQAEALKLTKAGSVNEYKASELLDYFRHIEDQPQGLEARTGFSMLDNKLQGGLHEGLHIIGAISSLGKTTFALQLADQIAESGQDVLFFSLEMSKHELLSKSISRSTYIVTEKRKGLNGFYIARDTAQIMNNRKYKSYSQDERKAIQMAIERYSAPAEHVYIYEGRYKGERLTVQHIKAITRKHKEATGNTPIVFVDYLQIIAPADARATDKQNTDTAVFELKELSRDLKTAVFAISSFNRDNYTEPVNMASFKESGAVEYSSDLLFGLQYAGMDYQSGESDKSRSARLRDLTKEIFRKKEAKEPIEIELKCLKNRNGYQFTVCFTMQAAFNYFEEANETRSSLYSTSRTKAII